MLTCNLKGISADHYVDTVLFFFFTFADLLYLFLLDKNIKLVDFLSYINALFLTKRLSLNNRNVLFK